ncbi:MAG: sulfate ABC transporter substrate-binding protein [Actinomycetota bacterium]
MRPRFVRGAVRVLVFLAAFALVAAACGGGEGDSTASGGECTMAENPAIYLVGYSTPREVYGKIIPAFQSMWKEKHDGQSVTFYESWAGSTTQAQNVINGQRADVVVLSLSSDVEAIREAGLITYDWTKAPDDGMVSTSVVVFDVRPGNPLGLEDFDDLTDPGVEILTPDPAVSGGARWNLVAAYGAAMRGYAGNQEGDEAGATALINGIAKNILTLDKSARDSIQNFESGNGNVAITYENEVKTANEAGLPDEAVYPPSTILIENPAAIVDVNARAGCVMPVAKAFVKFLHSREAKEMYESVGFLRPTDLAEARKGDPANGFPPIHDLWTTADFGGWPALDELLFSIPDGIATKAIAEAAG